MGARSRAAADASIVTCMGMTSNGIESVRRSLGRSSKEGVRVTVIAGAGSVRVCCISLRTTADQSTVACLELSADVIGNVEVGMSADMRVTVSTDVKTDVSDGAAVVIELGVS